ncbi:MAG: lysophospholipase, partial [Rhodospirillaceae bacterium]|nr:lysophospholipase [Rhodospirillaceae bacterium]
MRAAALFLAVAALGGLAAGCAPEVQIVGRPFTAPALRADAIQTADGALLPLRAWLPAGKPKAVILALHGMNDYGKAFRAPAEAWAQRGIATYAYDQRGYGATAQPGVWAGTERLTGDFIAAVRLLRQRHPGVPIFAVGESMGGGVILAAMARPDAPRLDGVILSAPAVWARATMPGYYTATLWAAAHTVPHMSLSGRNLDRVPTDNRAALIEMGRDPLVQKEARVDAVWGVVNLMDAAYAGAAHLHEPVLLLYGERDKIIPRPPIEAVAHRLPPGAKLALYPRGYHLLFRDLQAATVHRDVAAWIADR